ncbi:Magnesium and cobalt efflux protein CorC [Corynebacterium occultum]|uniref:Magnesium and cobalt efflux protein CorC n=1 Tax=Corynebacterium occultum TaxID=2675219 RepID=A0A6B8W361_9CORY|nr:hemolysin family protein [Corynebacterium occultum]QGU07924.1 Magnesium and cobalt efflux protein CorC [Corynebacterium occultum]
MGALTFALVTVLTLLLAGLIGTVEAAVSSISRARVEQLVKDEVAGAPALLNILNDRAKHINLLVLLQTVLSVAAAVFAASLAMALIDNDLLAFTLAVLSVSLVSFAVIGFFARTMGRKNPYTISLRSAMVLSALATVLGPVIRLLIWIGNFISPGSGFRDGPYATEIELREMVDIAQEHGIVEVEERRMIQSVFDLALTNARQVMVPRPEMIWIESDKTAGQAVSLCVLSGNSRIPVIGENVDDIIGVVYLKDLVEQTYTATDGGHSVAVTEVMREPSFVPDSKPLDELLHQMQIDHTHLVMLVDEYGGIAGLVTMEDILEEIVGEIADEYDEQEVAPIEQIAENTYRAVAWAPLEDLLRRIEEEHDLEIEIAEEVRDQVDTVSGLITFEIGRVPLPGVQVETHGLKLTGLGGRDRRGRVRVRSVLVEVTPEAGGESAADLEPSAR